jgi:hypothetical protein
VAPGEPPPEAPTEAATPVPGDPDDFVPPPEAAPAATPVAAPAVHAALPTCPRCPPARGPEVEPARLRPLDPIPGAPREPDLRLASRRRSLESHPYRPRRVACEEVARLARDVAPRHGLEPGLLVGIARVESAFTANVLSPVAAVGLSQVMPYVADKMGCGNLFDPAANLECGARILAGFLRGFDGNLVSALSGYNAGYGMPTRARKEVRTPRNFQYVEDVLRARSRWLRKGCGAWD